MKIFKFGGASVKNAEAVRNVKKVLEINDEDSILIVVSAMGKTTNALEEVVDSYFHKPEILESKISDVFQFHLTILKGLFPNASHSIYHDINKWFESLRRFLDTNKSNNHAFVYDQVVSYGELISSSIVSSYLNDQGMTNIWVDARKCIKTDEYYRDARVDWEATQKQISERISTSHTTITQGFIGAEHTNNFTTTLGREGSDYTAAIFAYCLNAESVTIWKDVPGVLNADPRYFSNTELLHQVSYREAIELAFYGASVIHPKTLQPLQRKEIPLYVKSFENPSLSGTSISKGKQLEPMVPCYILKKNRVLIALSSLDFSFMMEDNIGEVFNLLHRYKMKVDMMQNSAISFSVCIENKFDHLPALLSKLKEKFQVSHYEGVTLYTIRHGTPAETQKLTKGKEVLLKQETGDTVQVIVNE